MTAGDKPTEADLQVSLSVPVRWLFFGGGWELGLTPEPNKVDNPEAQSGSST